MKTENNKYLNMKKESRFTIQKNKMLKESVKDAKNSSKSFKSGLALLKNALNK